MMQTPLFRQTASDDLSSPDQLNTIMRVTTPKGWLALLTLVGLIAGALVWSVASEIPIGVTGGGVLLSGNGLDRVVAAETGQLQELFVVVGDSVSRGDIVGRVKPAEPADPPVELVSPFAGRVVETAVFPGDLVERGEAVLTLVPMGDDLSVVLLVPPAEGRSVQPGMEVQVSPSTVSSAEFGVMKGTVESVGDFPASTARIARLLGNDIAVRRFVAAGPLLEVHVALETDENTVSGYRWSSPQGPPTKLKSGTFIQGTVVVDRTRPIDLILAKAGL